MNPKVSVLVITYNQAETIGKALLSVVNQKCGFDYEVIIGDDCSTDGTYEICRRWADEYPHLIRLMPRTANKGIVDNFFDCLAEARGEYITDCAGDDYWISDRKLALMADMLDRNPSVNVVFSDWTIRDVATGAEHRASQLHNNLLGCDGIVPGDVILRDVLNHVNSLPYNVSASMYRRSHVVAALAEAPHAVRNRDFGCEDVPLIAALASRGDGIGLDVPTVCYNIYPDTVSNSGDMARQVRFYSRSLHCSAVLGDHYGVSQSYMREMFTAKTDYLLSVAFNSGDPVLRDIVTGALDEWMLPLSARSRVHLLAMQNRRVWRVARWLKHRLKRRLALGS